MGGPAQTQTITSTNTNATQRHQKQQEDDLCGDSLEGTTASTRATTSSLPPSIDLALLTTAHSLLQLNRAAAAAAAAASTSTTSSITSSSPSSLASTLLSAPTSSTSSIAGVYKGVKRFDENTPPIPTLLPHSAYSQLANLPKIFFPSSTQHHPGHAFLRPTTPAGSFLPSQQQHITFPFTASSTTPSISTPTSDTSKLQRLVEKLEKEPQGGQLPPEHMPDTSTECDTLSHSESMELSGLELSPSATDVQLLNADLQTISDTRHPESLAVSTASLSSGPIPPLDLTPDPSLNPTTHSPPTFRADPPELSLSVPSPVEASASLVPPATQSASATVPGPSATDELSFELSSNTAFLEDKKISSSSALKKSSPQGDDCERSENTSVSPIPCSGTRSNLEDLLSIQAHNASRVPAPHPESTPPSLLALRSEEPDQSLVHSSKLIPQEFPKEEKTEDMLKTPKNGQRTTPDLSNNAVLVSETNEDETEDRDTHVQKTIKEAHCSSNAKDIADLKDTTGTEMDRTESTVCISLTPSLPPPMPEKKIYHCSECGKEYASRSGLK
ncbi:hypothetical protein M9458_004342, partial [Cirrhinus mrigala]